jgi:hypothetical protein
VEVQLCKICGARHHRYEAHRFAGEPPEDVLGADGTVEALIEEARAMAFREGEQRAIAALSDYASFSDADLKACYNEVMKEVMRRRRAKRRRAS